MPTLPKYFVIKRDEKNPLWDKYRIWINKKYKRTWDQISWGYFGYDGSDCFGGTEAHDKLSMFENNPTLITLEFWNECVNGKKPPMTLQDVLKHDSEPKRNRHTFSTTITRDDGVEFTADSINGTPISQIRSELKEKRDLLNAHSHLFKK